MDPMPAVIQLRDAAYREARDAGFVPRGFALTPGEDDGPTHVRLLLTLTEDGQQPPVTLDAGLLSQLATVDTEARKRKVDEAQEGAVELERRLREGGDLL